MDSGQKVRYYAAILSGHGQQDLNLTEAYKLTCMRHWRSELTQWWYSIQIFFCPFYIWLQEVLKLQKHNWLEKRTMCPVYWNTFDWLSCVCLLEMLTALGPP